MYVRVYVCVCVCVCVCAMSSILKTNQYLILRFILPLSMSFEHHLAVKTSTGYAIAVASSAILMYM